jgi:hypothetical protein
MLRTWRILFLAVTWLFVLGVVLQVFLAGLIVFGGGGRDAHIGLGWLLHLVPVPILILAWAAKSGRTTLWLSLGLFISVFVQPFLPALRSSAPALAALHPVDAMVIFVLGLAVAYRAWRLWQSSPSAVTAA